VQKVFVRVFILFFALQVKLLVRYKKFEFCQIKLRYRITDNLQLTAKISLKLHGLLEYGCKY